MEIAKPSSDKIERFLEERKGRGRMTFKVLAQLNPFIVAMESELGQKILQDDIDRHEELLIKVYNENATPEEMAEFRYLKRRLEIIANRINTYTKGVKEVISNGK